VVEQLARIGRQPGIAVRPCIGSPNSYEYRNHARLAVARSGAALGYRAARSHQLVLVKDCPILEPSLRDDLRHWDGSVAAEDGDEATLQTWDTALAVGGFVYLVSEGAFFQANTAVAALLVDAVLGAVLDGLSLSGHTNVLDLYSGVGLFSVPIGKTGARVVGVEGNQTAAADAAINLGRAEVDGMVVTADVADVLRTPGIGGRRWDAIVLDPPRTGVEAPALADLAALAAARIAYVSCEPATLARDLHFLTQHGYAVEFVQPFDMFPQTHHVEALAVLRRRL
jgi:23S rRNA (uracil1939-C5)-methyltransferase